MAVIRLAPRKPETAYAPYGAEKDVTSNLLDECIMQILLYSLSLLLPLFEHPETLSHSDVKHWHSLLQNKP